MTQASTLCWRPMLRRSFAAVLPTCFIIASGCGDDDDDSSSELLVYDESASLTIKVIQNSPSGDLEEGEPISIMNQTGDYLVAVANASPRVVPISFGEAGADPDVDVLEVTLQVEEAFIDDIQQVELQIDLNSDGSIDWCEPMRIDALVPGAYDLRLQPTCDDTDRDPLTGLCIVTGSCEGFPEGCREDILTFALWNDISSSCHSEVEEG